MSAWFNRALHCAAWSLSLAFTSAGQAVERADEFNHGGRGSGPTSLTAFAGNLYFQADGGLPGRELMVHDGTSVAVAADLHPSGSSRPTALTVADGILYFTADDGQSGRRLWSFNGAVANLVDSNQFVANPEELIAFNDRLYFRGVRFGDVGIELFSYDGNAISIIDILPGTGSSTPQHLTEYAGALYFNAAGAPGQGTELWRYNGLASSKAGPEIRAGSGSSPAWLAVHDGDLYFSANNGVSGNELWRFDGVTSLPVADINPGGEFDSSHPAWMTSYAGALYFSANDGEGEGNELWRYDGFTVEMVANLNPNPPGPGGDEFLADSNPAYLTVHDGKLFFFADDGVHGRELWVCEGDSCRMVADIWSSDEFGSNPSGLAVVEGELYFAADSGEGFGLELYRVIPAPGLGKFGTITLAPALELNGAGSNVDSIAFWEAPDPRDTLMFVTGKSNDMVEVWRYPFENNELAPIAFPANVNGVAVDQETDLLYVSDRIVSIFALPGLRPRGDFGQGIIGIGENNLDILKQSNGQTVIYVSDDHNVHRFDAATWSHLGSFAPPVSSIETVLADDFYQRILVPEEQGPQGNPGVYAYAPDGALFEINGTNRFGNDGEFEADEEGCLLYTFPSSGEGDFGTGFIVVSDQKSDQTDFEFFDRRTWAHLGTLRIDGVSNTDGIASTQRAMPGYPLGVFAAINNDTTTVIVGWDAILAAIAAPYDLWAFGRGLVSGVNAGFTDDPDGDGCVNLKEFATDSDPLGGGHRRGRTAIEMVAGRDHFSITIPVRRGAVFAGGGAPSSTVDGVVYSLAGTLDLKAFDQDVVEVVPALDAGLPALNAGWSFRTFRLAKPVSEAREGFIRLSMTRER